jgi:hypothetical protein
VDLAGEYHPVAMEEPAYFDSIQGRLPDGEYKIKNYKVKFTPDFVGGGLSYDTFFGLRGQTYFVFSDYLGNHQIVVASDLVNTIDQSDILLFYLNNKKRISFGIGGFHTKNFYENTTRNASVLESADFTPRTSMRTIRTSCFRTGSTAFRRFSLVPIRLSAGLN